MATKNDERPTSAQDWLRKFNSSALYKHEPSRLFEDYLDLVLCCVANQRQEARYLQVAKRYTRNELNTVAELFAMHIVIHEHRVSAHGWYDMLGDIYMELASRSKASRMGQFFTPVEVCTMMAQMTLGEDLGVAVGKSICDPAAGSGRMLLAAHALQPKLGLIVGADLDPICTKMCALNFWMHGIRGEVACMNSLSLEWRFAYQTNPRILWPFVTFLDEERKEESLLYRDARELLRRAPEKQKPAFSSDLFNQVQDPEVEYGDPFRPCDLCGQVKSNACRVVNGLVVEPWEYHGPEDETLSCTSCGATLRNAMELQRTSEPTLLSSRTSASDKPATN